MVNDLCLLPNKKIYDEPGPSIHGDVLEVYTWSLDAALPYICGDGDDLSNATIHYLTNYVRRLKNDSPTLGATWAEFGFQCSGWRIRPWRHTGPFARGDASYSVLKLESTIPVNSVLQEQFLLDTSHPRAQTAPVIFLSRTTDAITPLYKAFAMSALQPGPSVVIQSPVGHCATYSSPSSCTKKVVE